jgi:poly(3-hydroxybutyrate) depolymerase
MNRISIRHAALATLAAHVALACQAADDTGAGTGGTTATNGGSGATGGSVSGAGTGGGNPTGGTGGNTNNGGSAGTQAGATAGGSGGTTSGTSGSGGGAGTAGSAAGRGSGGMSTSGGAGPTAGRGAGGAATGGMSAGGTAGMNASGAAGSSGTSSNPPSGDPIPSEGCSATPTTTACDTQSSPCTADIDGTMRKWWVELPDKYDPTHPYPVVFEYHPLGGNGWQGLTMYQIRPKMPEAIYVSPEGTGSGNLGFPNTNGMDEALTRKMMADLEAKYCVDKGRYYATGFSYGGSMSFTAACNMSDVFRAIGAMSGAPISGAKCTSKQPERPVAIWATHGDMDTALPITMAQPMIDALVKYNGCTTETKSVDPSPCVEYQGCKQGYPVVWCVRPGDPHAIPSFGAAAIAKFFQQF